MVGDVVDACARLPSLNGHCAPLFFNPQVLLVLAVWFLLWLGHPASLSPHFSHMRLRLRGQAHLLLRRRRAWAVAVTITTADAFAGAFLASMVFRFEVRRCPSSPPVAGPTVPPSPTLGPDLHARSFRPGVPHHTVALYSHNAGLPRRLPLMSVPPPPPPPPQTLENSSHFLLVTVITAVVTSALTGALLTMQPGRSAGLRLMYCLASIPAVTVVQVRLWVRRERSQCS